MELLAVIVILAIVLGIAVPGVLGMIHRAKKDAFKQSAAMLLEAGRLYYIQKMTEIESVNTPQIFYFPETTELEYSGEKPQDGYLTIDEDGSQYIEITNGIYCAYGAKKNQLQIKDGLCQDQTPGVLVGTGTEKDPYKIESIEDLVQFGKNVDEGNTYENKYITLERNLDFKNKKSYVDPTRIDYGDINENGTVESLLTELTTGKGFNPIGDYTNSKSFSGIWNGQNYLLSNLFINRETERNTGLFTVSNQVIQNMRLTGTVSGLYYSGLLVGTQNGVIENIEASGTVSASDNIYSMSGGITAMNNGTIRDTTFHGTLSATQKGQGLGGIAYINIGKINNVSVKATIDGSKYIGGIVAQNGHTSRDAANIYNARSDVTINGSDNLGGLVGMLSKGTIKNSYSTVNITAQNDPAESTEGAVSNAVGGVVGFIGCATCDHSLTKIGNVYATGHVSGVSEVGGLVGQNGASSENTKTKYLTVENGYSLGNVSGEQNAVGGVIGSNVMNARNLYAGGDVSGSKNVGNIVGRKENEDATITNVYSKEGQQVSGSNVLTLGSAVSLPTLSPSNWWKNTLGFDNNWKFEDGYYPLLYKVDESGNPTMELLPGQKKIPIQ